MKIYKPHRRRYHNHIFHVIISPFQTSVYPCSKGVSRKVNLLYSHFGKVRYCRVYILLFAFSLIVIPLAFSNSPEVESQCCKSMFLIGTGNSFNYRIIHVSAIEGMRMGYNNPFIIRFFFKQPFYFVISG